MGIERDVLELQREFEGLFTHKDCAKCQAEVSMVRVEAFGKGPPFLGYRCLKCGALYEEVLQEVKPDAR